MYLGKIFSFFRNLCKKKQDINFMTLCVNNDILSIKNNIHQAGYHEIIFGLSIAIKNLNSELAELLITNSNIEKQDLDKFLEITASQNNFVISEFLLEKGADPNFGLKYTSSPNLINLLYKYKN